MDISLTERTTERNPGHLSWNLVREGMRRVSLKVFCIGLRWRVCLFYLPIISTFKHSWKLEGFNTFNFEQWLIVVRHGSTRITFETGSPFVFNFTCIWPFIDMHGTRIAAWTDIHVPTLHVVTRILTPLLLCCCRTMCCCDCCGECYHICCWAKLGWVVLVGRTKRDPGQGYKDNDHPHPTPSSETNIIISSLHQLSWLSISITIT